MSNPHYQITFFGPNTESGYDLEFIDATTNQKYGIWEPDLDEVNHHALKDVACEQTPF